MLLRKAISVSYEVSSLFHFCWVACTVVLGAAPMPVYSLDCTLHHLPTPGQFEGSDMLS